MVTSHTILEFIALVSECWFVSPTSVCYVCVFSISFNQHTCCHNKIYLLFYSVGLLTHTHRINKHYSLRNSPLVCDHLMRNDTWHLYMSVFYCRSSLCVTCCHEGVSEGRKCMSCSYHAISDFLVDIIYIIFDWLVGWFCSIF